MAVFGLLLLQGTLNPGKGGVGLQVACMASVFVCAVLSVRGFRSGTMLTYPENFVYRTLFRTYRWPRASVGQFGAEDARVGVGGYRRRVLTVTFSDGRSRQLTAMNCEPSEIGGRTWIDDVARDLNYALQGGR